jgi:hypothetical protein
MRVDSQPVYTHPLPLTATTTPPSLLSSSALPKSNAELDSCNPPLTKSLFQLTHRLFGTDPSAFHHSQCMRKVSSIHFSLCLVTRSFVAYGALHHCLGLAFLRPIKKQS